MPYTAGISATAIDGTHLQLTQAGGQTTTVTGAFSIDYNYIVSADGSNNTQVTLPFAGKTFFVSNEAQLNQAILDLTVAPAGAFTIELMNNITEGSYGSDVLTTPTGGSVTAPLDPFAISLPNPTATLTIDGSNVSGVNYAVDGTRQYRGLLVYSGHVVLQNLIIQNAKAQGGAGGSGLVGGGGGAGLGGGLFVSTGSQVTISNVTFSNDRATGGDGGTGFGGAVGGAGGGGGLGGAGGSLTAQNPKLTPISGSGTGTGKTHRAIAIARACIRSPSVGYPLSNLATWRSANFGRAKFDWLRYTNARPMGKR